MLRASNFLVIDDDRTIAVWLSTLFRRFGFSVLIAHDGLIGLSMAREHRPDLVVLDYNLPGIHGAEVLHTLRRERAPADLSIVMISGESDLDIDALLDGGVDAFLSKHADGLVVLNTVRTVLENRRTASRFDTGQRPA